MKLPAKTCFLLLATVFLIHCPAAYAQDSQTVRDSSAAVHQRFKSTEICGPATEFMARLNENGFAGTPAEGNDSDKNVFTGLFAGYKVRLHLLLTPLTKTVYGVVNHLDHRGGFEDAYKDYKTFLEHLSAVYGEPAIRNEAFENPYRRGDGYSIRALKEGKAKFISIWDTPNGVVTISIIAETDNQACLMIAYTDDAGEQLSQDEKTQIIRRDL